MPDSHMQSDTNTSWYALDLESVYQKLDTQETGLTQQDVLQRQAQFGANCLAEVHAVSNVKRFFRQFHNILIYILLASALITGVLGHYFDALVISGVVIANAIIGFVQEGKAESALESISHMLAPQAHVLRDNARTQLPAEELVPGDVIFLEPGDKVPADCRLISCHGMRVNEAILTGESLAVEKHLESVKEGAPLGDRLCMLYSGTMVQVGQGVAVVVATGANTEIGKINHLLSHVESLETPLVTQMAIFAKWLTVVILSAAALLLAYGIFLRDYAFEEIFIAVVSLSVAAIPEGLPAILTITLALGVKVMAKRHAIVRRLPSIETIGSVSVICTDKTGTLTRNEMIVSSVLTSQGIYTVDGQGYAPVGNVCSGDSKIESGHSELLNSLARACLFCNDAALQEKADQWTVVGDPMEGALLALSAKLGLNSETEKQSWSRVDLIPFDAEYRYMATLNRSSAGENVIFVKGAPERILSMCAGQIGSESGPDTLDVSYWQKEAELIASMGQRVLALAYLPLETETSSISPETIKGKLILLGMVGMIDPPREEAIIAVAECRSAGINVKMITGDHAGTALAIAKKVGLEHLDQALTGEEIDKLTDADLALIIQKTDVFARTSPEHKLRLVMSLQSQNERVAMTGDGVNDAPALQRADIGIAMGKKGSEAAKEASDIVLTDDNFASIVAAVREGRTVYDNIQKVVSWTLPTSFGEAAIIAIALLFGWLLPITPIQILYINLITTVTLGFALAFDPSEKGVMQRAPREKNAPLINGHLIWQIFFVSFLFVIAVFSVFSFAQEQHYSNEHAQTLALHTLVTLEVFQLLFIRNLFNSNVNLNFLNASPIVWMTIGLVMMAQILIIYVPFMQGIFGTHPISLFEWGLISFVGLALFIILEIEKQLRKVYIRV